MINKMFFSKLSILIVLAFSVAVADVCIAAAQGTATEAPPRKRKKSSKEDKLKELNEFLDLVARENIDAAQAFEAGEINFQLKSIKDSAQMFKETSFEQRFNELSGQRDELLKLKRALKNKASALKSRKKQRDAAQNALKFKTENFALKKKVAILKGLNTKLEADKTSLRNLLAKWRTDNTSLYEEVHKLKEERDSLKAEVAQLIAEVNFFTADIGSGGLLTLSPTVSLDLNALDSPRF